MITIPLTQGQVALIDEEDFSTVSQYKWNAFNAGCSWYAIGKERVRRGKWKTIQMHRLILNPPKPFVVDHINRNGLDNRKSNLRVATQSQNIAHSVKRKGCLSEFKGIFWHQRRNRWVAKIRKKIGDTSKSFHLGSFMREIDAAIAYDRAAKEFHGEFARLNIPHGNTSDAHLPEPRPSDNRRGAGLRFDSGSNFFVWQLPCRTRGGYHD